jgi:hypothetical protein
MIPSSELIEGDRRIRYDALTERANAIVDDIRQSLSDGIANGRVILAPKSPHDDGEDTALSHPALDILRVAALADSVIVDDRYLNQHGTVTHDNGGTTPIQTTFDVLASLRLPQDEHNQHISQIRSAGLAFVAVTSDELGSLLSRAAIADDQLVETAELKALRENLQLCRMSNGLQLPKEAHWFDGVVRALIKAIKAQWHEGIDTAAARARSTWLLQQLDIRGWAHPYVNDQNRGFSEFRFRAQLMALMTFSVESPLTVRQAYWEWLEHVLLEGVRDQQGDVYRAVVQAVSRLINTAASGRKAGDANDD